MKAKVSVTQTTDEQILAAAEAILLKRPKRHGKVAEPSEAGRYLRARVGHCDREVSGCLFLDTRHRILASEDLFHGTIDGAEVHPLEVVKRGLLLNVAAVVAFHNHPLGSPEPSGADRALTSQLKQALALVDIRLLDHIIISAEGFCGMAARGWV